MAEKVLSWIEFLEGKLLQLANRYSLSFLRISIGLVYFVFGVLKFFPSLSPAEELAGETINMMTFGLISPAIGLVLLAIMESAIGFLLITNRAVKLVLVVAISHMLCTFLPLILLPSYSFQDAPFTLSIVGQYIIKNIILVSAMLVLYAQRGKQLQN